MHYAYKNAGYDSQEWKTPSKDSRLLGIYQSDEGEILVEYLRDGPSELPELKLSFENGRILTVCCEDVAKAYLDQFAAKKTRRQKRAFEPAKLGLGHWHEP